MTISRKSGKSRIDADSCFETAILVCARADLERTRRLEVGAVLIFATSQSSIRQSFVREGVSRIKSSKIEILWTTTMMADES
jgi:hypothetical protein